jgi:hypothetical protein
MEFTRRGGQHGARGRRQAVAKRDGWLVGS